MPLSTIVPVLLNNHDFKLRLWSRVCGEGTKKTFFSLSRLIHREYEDI